MMSKYIHIHYKVNKVTRSGVVLQRQLLEQPELLLQPGGS